MLLSIVGGGCAVGPDFRSPAPPQLTQLVPNGIGRVRLSGPEQQTYVQGLGIPRQWWALFQCPQLNAVVERAIAENADIAAARAAVRIASANASAAGGNLLPQVSANFDGSRQQPTAAQSATNGGTTSPYSLRTGQLSVSYMPDVFGLTRRHIESLDAQTEQQHFELQAAYLTLTARVALTAIEEAALRAEIRAAEKSMAVGRELLDALQQQFKARDVSRLDVTTQQAALAQIDQTLPALQKRLATTRDLMIALTGHLAGEGLVETFEFECLHLPAELPVSLPSEIVRQRPDVRAAEANMHSATAEIGVAIANRLPQFNLNANVGASASTVASIAKIASFSSPLVFWTLAGSATQLLFDGFSAEQKQRAAEAGLDRAAALYRSAVISAFQNVADVLQSIETDHRAVTAAARGERAARANLDLTREMVKLGQATAQQALSAQQLFAQGTVNVVRTKAATRSDAVMLFQALGGGWSRRETPPQAAATKWRVRTRRAAAGANVD